MKHILSELFYSVQGEGKYTGCTSIFIRYFGCTLRCPGFSRPRTEGTKENAEVKNIIDNLQQYEGKDIKDFPLVKTGCDSYISTYPCFKKWCKEYTTEELIEKLKSIKPVTNVWENVHLVMTGGEPLINQLQIVELIEKLIEAEHIQKLHVTFETNGTVELKQEVKEKMNQLSDKVEWLFSVSPKLSLSGEPREKTLFADRVANYNKDLNNSSLYLKYVARNSEDLKDIIEFTEAYNKAGVNYEDIYLMPEGGKVSDEVNFTNKEIANICMKYGYRFCLRAHLVLFGNAWAT